MDGRLKKFLKNYYPWFVIALVALAIIFLPFPGGWQSSQARTIEINASSFAYDPGVIKVGLNDQVTIKLNSQDVVHGLYLDGYNLEMHADPGQPSSMTFQADQAGTFRFRCSVTCGSLHPFMIGKLQVGPNIKLWRGIALATLAVLGLVWMKQR
jgi:heme/copper-type cytochrome/quinol oxidase subunit 2